MSISRSALILVICCVASTEAAHEIRGRTSLGSSKSPGVRGLSQALPFPTDEQEGKDWYDDDYDVTVPDAQLARTSGSKGGKGDSKGDSKGGSKGSSGDSGKGGGMKIGMGMMAMSGNGKAIGMGSKAPNPAPNVAPTPSYAPDPVSTPSPMQPTAPTPSSTVPSGPCPDVPLGGCSICGDGMCITLFDGIFSFPGQPSVNCNILEQAGYDGGIVTNQCDALSLLTGPQCGCNTSRAPIVAPSPTPAPTPPPSLEPTPPPTLDGLSPVTPNPTQAPPTPMPTTIATPGPTVLRCQPTPMGGCSICGNGSCVTNDDAIFMFPGQPSATCSVIQGAGYGGGIDLAQCIFLPAILGEFCGCAPGAVPRFSADSHITMFEHEASGRSPQLKNSS